MGRLSLQLLGGLRTCSPGGADGKLLGRKAQALLAYLALNPRQRCTRDRLAGLLWSDRGDEQARQSLRQTIHALHRALHDDSAAILIADGDRLTLDREAVTVDVHDFERLSVANTRESLKQAEKLYAGDLLEGIDTVSEQFDTWLATERMRLRDRAVDVLERLAQTHMDTGEWEAALDAGRRLLALDPVREDGHRVLMRLYDRTGRRVLALRQYRILVETLRRELDAAPAPETERVYSEIRARTGKEPAGTQRSRQHEFAANVVVADDRASTLSLANADEESVSVPFDHGNADLARGPSPPSSRRFIGWISAAATVVAIAAIGAVVWKSVPSPTLPTIDPTNTSIPAAPRLSIVVLPFVNLSNDPEQEYFADGLTDSLTTEISYIEDSSVIARSTAFTYKGKTIDAREIGHQLGVRYVLEGSVQRSDNKIRVNAQLIDAGTGTHLWAETFDRERGDVFAIQDEITKHIAATLNLQLINIEVQRAEREGTSVDALDYIMRGNVLIWRGQTKENSLLALAMYEKALQLDEHSPRALASVAIMLTLRVLDEFSDAPEDDLRRAEQLAAKALAIDPNYWEAHLTKAQILRARKHYDDAIVEYETANSLNPLAVNSRLHLARAKILIGEPAAAIPLLEQVIRISPRDPQIGFMYYRLGLANLMLGNTDEAIYWYKRAAFTYYDPADAYLEMGAAFSLEGDKAAAQAALAEAAKLSPERLTIASARKRSVSEHPKFVELREQTLIKGLRMAGLPEE
ncbi:MAG TPA: BTAD domain-containing putative transcriptional regulator [Stellaceae bacterium]|nr:BTAD domain-containing putative transcriptional regulator [Stellaceae bacterium]